jgi:tRNA 2-thiouridine synthesizing protein A
MSETQLVDARGLSCPMPAMLARQALLRVGGGTVVEVLVDNGTSCENVARLAEREGWRVTLEEQPDGLRRLVLRR